MPGRLGVHRAVLVTGTADVFAGRLSAALTGELKRSRVGWTARDDPSLSPRAESPEAKGRAERQRSARCQRSARRRRAQSGAAPRRPTLRCVHTPNVTRRRGEGGAIEAGSVSTARSDDRPIAPFTRRAIKRWGEAATPRRGARGSTLLAPWKRAPRMGRADEKERSTRARPTPQAPATGTGASTAAGSTSRSATLRGRTPRASRTASACGSTSSTARSCTTPDGRTR